MSVPAAVPAPRIPVGRLETLLGRLPEGGRLPELVSGLSRQNSVYRHVLDVGDRLAEAAVCGADARTLAGVLADRIGGAVVLLDPRFDLRCGVGNDFPAALWASADPGVLRLRQALQADRRAQRVAAVPGSVLQHGCLAVPIAIGANDLGYLVLPGCPPDAGTADAGLFLASRVATVFALTLAAERGTVECHRAAAVESLVSGRFTDADDARRKLEVLRLAGAPVRVGVVCRAAGGAQQLLEGLRAAGLATTVRGAELVMILPASPDDDVAVVDSLTSALAVRPGESRFTCGLGDAVEHADLLPQSLLQAERAGELGLRVGRAGELVRYRDLGIYRLLLQIGDMAQLDRFADEVLGPLVRYDATHKLGLVRTLSVYLGQRGSLKLAALRLGVHANTVSYRLHRIEQLTPLHLADPEDMLMAHVAVKILEAQKVAPDR